MTEPEKPSNDSTSSDAAAAAPADADKAAPEASPTETASSEAAAEDAKAAEAKAAEDDKKSTPRGNPLRRKRGGITAGIGSALAFLLMSNQGQLSFGVPLGILCVAVAAFGFMDLLGTYDDADEHVAGRTTLSALKWPIGQVVASIVLYGASIYGGQSGVWNQWGWGVIVTATFLTMVASIFALGVKLGPFATDEDGNVRPLLQRHGFWLLCVGSVLYLPALGVFSLWDPWETHYGEVAREILARNDWISLWWAQDGWFWSKPILNFWIQAVAMATMGTHYQPDQMLMGAGGAMAHPEWVVRTPNVLLTLLAMYLLYKGVAKVFGRRAGLVAGIVLATVPDWFFLAHQTMADMPFVAPMTSAMGLLLLGLHTDENRRVKVYEVKVGSTLFRFSGWHLVFGAILMVALPEILYLLSRNLELITAGTGDKGFRFHWDEFRSGSGMGNCGLPGNEACNPAKPAALPKTMLQIPDLRAESHGGGLIGMLKVIFVVALPRWVFAIEPSLQAIVWAGLLGTLLYLNWGERRAQRLYYLAAWFFAALATMGKGPAGFALPILCALTYIGTKKRWSELLRLELVSGLLIILCVAMPWYVAMYMRHGSQFTDRLIFHDMWNRAFSHVHDTNEGDDTSLRYYVWQLGYALFPWTGLAPLGLAYWLRRSDSADRGKGDVSVFLFMWFLFSFTLFSLMGTKFHHYIFPAVPPIAMLVGITFNDMLGKLERPKAGWPAMLSGLAGAALIAVVGLTWARGGSFFGTGEASAQVYLLVAGGVLIAGYFVLPKLPLDRFAAMTPATAPSAAVPVADAPPQEEREPAGAVYVGIGGLLALAEGTAGTAEPTQDEATEAPEVAEGRRFHETLLLGAAAIGAAFVLVLIGRDLVLKPEGADQPGAIRLLQLFTYNYRRPWPDDLDFAYVLFAFTTVAALCVFVAGAVAKLRQKALLAFGAVALVWGLWGVDVYMRRTSQHWGQHEVIEAYYTNRKDDSEQLVAYQMNWKGENFYTGNKIPAFVSSGANFTNWLKTQREKGAKVMYFITEHSRVGGLRNEAAAKSLREVTDKKLCNKFVLVRAEL